MGDVLSVGGGVFELRIFYGPGYRVYCGLENDQDVILLCGGTKATQKRDIRRAADYWDDFRRRSNGNE